MRVGLLLNLRVLNLLLRGLHRLRRLHHHRLRGHGGDGYGAVAVDVLRRALRQLGARGAHLGVGLAILNVVLMLILDTAAVECGAVVRGLLGAGRGRGGGRHVVNAVAHVRRRVPAQVGDVSVWLLHLVLKRLLHVGSRGQHAGDGVRITLHISHHRLVRGKLPRDPEVLLHHVVEEEHSDHEQRHKQHSRSRRLLDSEHRDDSELGHDEADKEALGHARPEEPASVVGGIINTRDLVPKSQPIQEEDERHDEAHDGVQDRVDDGDHEQNDPVGEKTRQTQQRSYN
mmetsp:Transcript_66537/g.164025  ORF Transcript_66537/g.164025 Transcript_66537/m.164025 type:complete len:286 (-) Transcript_66537:1921-2778(-)